MKRVRTFLRLLFQSRISTAGAVLVTTGFFADVILIFGELLVFESNPYIGIVSHMMLPGLIVLGLLLIPVGIAWRIYRAGHGFSLAEIDALAASRRISPAHVTQVVFTLTLVNLVVLGVMGYRGFHYTESAEFCGELCHEVMAPEFAAYKRSPHSQISCAKCHIGPGAGWFVKSKLSGARQVVAVVANSYSRPIETPVHNLRPAREVCEVCHRPDVFHGNLMRVIEHFEPDEANTQTFTVLNMRVGAGDGPGQTAHGIHWHVSKEHEVRYFASDEKREQIDFVELRNPDGTFRRWTREGSAVDPASVDEASMRTMDCVDCHNRPTHIFLPPARAIDDAMASGTIDPAIPWIRQLAEEVITPAFATREEADAAIGMLPAIYAERHPEAWEEHEGGVRAATTALRDIHREQVFPEMNIQWNTYNSLIGHATPHTGACFRCHDGMLRDEQLQPITLDCNACHYLLANRETNPRILDRLERR